jgi:uncharacterized LabA/DUF88 family protein
LQARLIEHSFLYNAPQGVKSESVESNKSNNFAFIDSQNLNLGLRTLGWVLDYKKFRLYLRHKYNVTQAYVFIGLVPDNEQLYNDLQNAGFILIFKQTVQYLESGKETVKGNVDADLVLHAAAIQYANYDKAVIVSGDGDFAGLIEFLKEKGKLQQVLAPNRNYSKLLKPYAQYIVRIDKLKKSLEYKKSGIGVRSKP